MKITKLIYRSTLALATALLMGGMSMNGGILTDLPTIRVNGKVMYYYDAQSGDNIYTIAEKLGVSVEQIRANNPSVSEGVKPRMRLLFPSDIATDDSGNSAGPLTHVVEKGESVYGIAHKYGMTVDELMALNPAASKGIRPGQRLLLSSSATAAAPVVSQKTDAAIADASSQLPQAEPVMQEPQSEPISVESQDEQAVQAVEAEPIDIAVILPFMLNEEKLNRQAQLYTEFYKGFLLAASEANQDGRTPLKIHAFDSAANLDSVRALMQLPQMRDMEMILAPENPAQLAAVASGAPKDALILNIFAVKDTTYLANPAMIQTNIPHDEMYERAVEGYLARFADYTPVFLTRKGGKTDKEEFTELLKTALSMEGIAYQTIQFEGYLSDADLELIDPNMGKYVFIPASGNRDEFSRIYHAVKALSGRAEDPNAIQVFGYPEWATFRGDQFKEICELNTTIYSRYNPTEQSFDARELDRKFTGNYGEGLIEKQLPVMGILGYDMGRYVIDAMRHRATTGELPVAFDGIQSSFRMEVAGEDGGLFNNALYLINYAPGQIVTHQLVSPNFKKVEYAD